MTLLRKCLSELRSHGEAGDRLGPVVDSVPDDATTQAAERRAAMPAQTQAQPVPEIGDSGSPTIPMRFGFSGQE